MDVDFTFRDVHAQMRDILKKMKPAEVWTNGKFFLTTKQFYARTKNKNSVSKKLTKKI